MSIKQRLYDYCVSAVEDKIQRAEEALRHLQSSHETESKSSMGDKYETGRAMINLEKEKVAQQLNEASKMRKLLAGLDPEKSSDKIGAGSLVVTDVANFFISVSLGRMTLEGDEYFIISPISPIGQQLLDKGVGDTLSFAGKSQKIIRIL